MSVIFDNEPCIYTTGAFLQPLRVVDSTGREIWVWRVTEFTDDSFRNGGIYNPSEIAGSKDELIRELV